MKILFVVVSGLLIACAPEGRLPAEPEQTVLDVDDPRQREDSIGSPPFAELLDMEQALALAKASVVIQPPPEPRRIARAWLEPNPSQHNFIDENPFWQTFTVRAVSGIDSVYVLANPRMDGITQALETAGGSEPPFRNFCPASWDDHPSRARRPGWPLHLSACAEGLTYLILYGWSNGELQLFNIYPITVK